MSPLVYTIECENCGESRLARRKDDEIRPYIGACRSCGDTRYVVLAED